MIQKEQTDLIGWMEDRQLVLYIQEHGITSNKESQPREKHGMRRHASKAVFESEPEERHDDHQVAFQVQSQQCCCKGLATRDTAKRELVDASQVRLTSVLQPQFDGQYAVDDVNVGTVSSQFLQKQDFGDLSTEQTSERGGVGQERRRWTRDQLHDNSCAEVPFQAGWKESLQSKLPNETLIMKSQHH